MLGISPLHRSIDVLRVGADARDQDREQVRSTKSLQALRSSFETLSLISLDINVLPSRSRMKISTINLPPQLRSTRAEHVTSNMPPSENGIPSPSDQLASHREESYHFSSSPSYFPITRGPEEVNPSSSGQAASRGEFERRMFQSSPSPSITSIITAQVIKIISHLLTDLTTTVIRIRRTVVTIRFPPRYSTYGTQSSTKFILSCALLRERRRQ